MKKVVALITSLVLSLVIFCVPSYAADSTHTFNQHFEATNLIVGGLVSGQYDLEFDASEDFYRAYSYSNSLTYYGAYLRTSFNHYASKNDRLLFKLKLTVSFNSAIDQFYEYIYPKININTGRGWERCGDIFVVRRSDLEAPNNGYPCIYDVVYTVDYLFPDNCSNIDFTFDFVRKNNALSSFHHVTYDFDPYLNDFYFGDGKDPDLPVYSGPTESEKDVIDDYISQEEELFGNTADGTAYFTSFTNNIGTFLSDFSVPLTAIAHAVNWVFDDIPLLNSIVYISIGLGLVSFVLNIISSIVSLARRDGSERSRRERSKAFRLRRRRQ